MARKSRKTPAFSVESAARQELVAPDYIQESTLATAAYIRLSTENSGHETDDTLKTQIQLVQSYVNTHPELTLTDTYVDNGYTGTRFDRPAFNRMMDDIKTGRIQCVVVKDLSRFGRDYLETGYYLEQIFPLLNVRFIAITDQYDSTRPESRSSVMVPIKNMVNAMYAKDMSRKIKAAVKIRQEQGVVYKGFAPFGYIFNESKKCLEIDPESEPYVRVLFAWHLIGRSRTEIADRMNKMTAPTPGFKRFGRNNGWYSEVVRYFLTNPAYAGTIATGRRESDLCAGLYNVKKPRDEWKLTPNAHEAYLTQEDSDRIVKRMETTKAQMDESYERTKDIREAMYDVFHGKVYCGCCGSKMRHRRGSHHVGPQQATFQFYRCLNRKKVPNCHNNHIFQQDFLKIVAMDQIRLLMQTACDKDELIRNMERRFAAAGKQLPIERKIGRLREKLNTVEGKLYRAYTDFAEHLLTEEDYLEIREKMISDRGSLTIQMQEQEAKLEKIKTSIDQFHRWADHLRGNLKNTGFNESLVNELVGRITVYDEEHIEFEFSCKDVFQAAWMDELNEEGSDEE